MCKHQLRYLLKEHDNKSYAGIMLELDGVIAHAATVDKLKSILNKKSLFLIKSNEKLHERLENNELKPILRKSTLGNPQQIQTITVDCGPTGN